MLRGPFRVRVVTRWRAMDAAPALMIALHARRSADAIEAFAATHPDRPLVVALTGTDLYRDIAHDATAQRSLRLATQLIVLNDLGPRQLPPDLRTKASIVVQSAASRAPASKSRDFSVAVVGHLREEKNPQLVWRVLDGWPTDVPVRVLHAGFALDPTLGRQARQMARRDPRYIWLGNQPRGVLRRRVAACHVLLHPSSIEGGALAIIEAITAGTPVIASRIDGHVGLLGSRYPGLFATDDADAARSLLLRAATDARFRARLADACDRIAGRFAPAREQRDLRRVVHACLRSSRQGPSPAASRMPSG